MPVRLWVDVEDLFVYARSNPRPSGIQRVAGEIYRTMQEEWGSSGLVQFVRHDVQHESFRTIPWSEVADVFERLTDLEVAPSTAPVSGIARSPPTRRFLGRLLHRLAPQLRPDVIGAVLAQAEAFRAWRRLARTTWHALRRRLRHRLTWARRGNNERSSDGGEPAAPNVYNFVEYAEQGDILLALGAPWSHPDYAKLIRGLHGRGLRFALLVYDLIPIRRPEWCDRGLVQLFGQRFGTLLPLCDFVFAISRATAIDVEKFARENKIALPGPVLPLPIGTGFGSQQSLPSGRPILPAGTYVLFVSTIEARKNHALLFRVWRRLLEEMPAEHVPTLVFAGRIGWLVDDLMRQIANTEYLDGKLVVIEDPTDADLAGLYRGCLFTLFPSYYEGWGLPVTESLAFGKPCIIANRTSLPEAGGRLARSFDPDNLHDAYHVIRQTIEDRPGLAQWEAEVRREFRPVPWSATVTAILAGLKLSAPENLCRAESARPDSHSLNAKGDAKAGISALGAAIGR